MKKTLFFVGVKYNGTRPHVTVNMNWNRFFAGIWQGIQSFFNAIKKICIEMIERRNVYFMNIYVLIIFFALFFSLEPIINTMETENINFWESIWNNWRAAATSLGIESMAHQIGGLVLLLAIISLLCKPAAEWEIYFTKLCLDKSLSTDIRWQLLKQKANTTINSMNATFYGTCGWIVKIALATATVWFIWTMLQG